MGAPTRTVDELNAWVSVGGWGGSTTRVAVAALPVPPLVEVDGLVVLTFVPGVVRTSEETAHAIGREGHVVQQIEFAVTAKEPPQAEPDRAECNRAGRQRVDHRDTCQCRCRVRVGDGDRHECRSVQRNRRQREQLVTVGGCTYRRDDGQSMGRRVVAERRLLVVDGYREGDVRAVRDTACRSSRPTTR